MQHLVEKFAAIAAEAADEDGAVAIEYVFVAGFVAAGIAVVFATGLWGSLNSQLDDVLP